MFFKVSGQMINWAAVDCDPGPVESGTKTNTAAPADDAPGCSDWTSRVNAYPLNSKCQGSALGAVLQNLQ
jgi:hypothetical protein